MASSLITKTDHAISTDVRAELGWDPMVTVADLDVVSSNGYVTLSGTAASASSKYAAEGAAYRMFGVRDVTNDIVVDLTAITLRSDDAVQADVRSAIALWTAGCRSIGRAWRQIAAL